MENGKQPAFAISKEMCEQSEITEYPYGLTKREYFAGLAMQGMIANNTMLEHNVTNVTNDSIVWATFASIKLADELLKQLENGK